MPGHPRLYLTSADIPALRAARCDGVRSAIWRHLARDAEWCLARQPRTVWIAPIAPDPRYENLYDRFYAIMADLAITEHLGFAYALSGDARYGEAARTWTLASCRIWQCEADGPPDGGKAYAVCRLLKGIATGYDLTWDRFTEAERVEIRDVLTRIATNYFQGYFSTPERAEPEFHTHHAIVEYASFGITALALLDEIPDASLWLDAVTAKFERDLLPRGLAGDGAQTEGASFYASTMQYRLMFMDALQRVTGHDLFAPYERFMGEGPALAAIAAEHDGAYTFDHASVVLQPSYAQLDYYTPVLLGLSRFYDRPLCRRLALWDRAPGSLQRTRFMTPHGEQLLFSFGGYAYLWYTDGPSESSPGTPLAWHFPSVDEGYLRAGWELGGLLASVNQGEMVIHAGGRPVLVEPSTWRRPLTPRPVQYVTDDGERAEIVCGEDGETTLRMTLTRPDRLTVNRRSREPWVWRCAGAPVRDEQGLFWPDGVRIRVLAGMLEALEPDAVADTLAVANGLLELPDPAPVSWTRVTIRPPEDGMVILEVVCPT